MKSELAQALNALEIRRKQEQAALRRHFLTSGMGVSQYTSQSAKIDTHYAREQAGILLEAIMQCDREQSNT